MQGVKKLSLLSWRSWLDWRGLRKCLPLWHKTHHTTPVHPASSHLHKPVAHTKALTRKLTTELTKLKPNPKGDH
jgi:hypothetical protein